MSQSSGSVVGGGPGPDFDIPDEILSVIPTDPYDQLDLARKITSMAIASRVSKLEVDVGMMRQKLLEKDHVIYELDSKVSHLERAYGEADSRLKIVLDENVIEAESVGYQDLERVQKIIGLLDMKLSKERDSLLQTTMKLGQDIAKLETFKRQLKQSLSDDNVSQTETVDIQTCDQSIPKAYPDTDAGTNSYTTQHSYNGSRSAIDEASRHGGQRFSMTPYLSPWLTPSGTPKIVSTSGSPRGYSTTGSPNRTSSMASPKKQHYEGRTPQSSWYPSSQQSSAANSPPRGRPLPARTPRVDGKEFFRQARSRLSYEQFSAFLANIKELNAQKQTREETLSKAEEIFGIDNKDLYLSFQGLLNRNVH